MDLKSIRCFLIVTTFFVDPIWGHGMMMNPIQRSSMWREKYNVPTNYDDNALNCGGRDEIIKTHKCVCGDDFRNEVPRENENTGKFGTGIVVQQYQRGQIIPVAIQVTANHKGQFYFDLCQLEHPKLPETMDCFKTNLTLADGEPYYNLIGETTGFFNMSVQLPDNIKCDRCVFRWHWVAGNNPDGIPEEEFFNCADISIS